MAVASGQQYNIGEKAAVTLLYTCYIPGNRYAGTPKTEAKSHLLKNKTQLCYVRFCLVSDSSVAWGIGVECRMD